MNELKLGHRVLAWDDNSFKTVKGRYLFTDRGNSYILEDGTEDFPDAIYYKNVTLDPDAKEFLTGDEVEVSQDGEFWKKAEYIGKTKNLHTVRQISEVLCYLHCRYPPTEQRELPDWVGEIKFPELVKMWKAKGGKR